MLNYEIMEIMEHTIGCIDYFGSTADKLVHMISVIQNIFIDNGGEYLETPVFEKKEIAKAKYACELTDTLVLRYDHTVPFIRFIKEHAVKKMRRFSIGKVYRPISDTINELYQCDFDILGESDNSMLPEILIFTMIADILSAFQVKQYSIVINDIDNLKALLLDKLGVPSDKFETVCLSIDKLEKCTFEEIVPGLIEAGMKDQQITQLEETLVGRFITSISTEERMKKIRSLAASVGFADKITFEPALVPKFDYYTGIVFEVRLNNKIVMTGGRYGDLFGFSIDLNRLMNYVEHKPVPRRQYFVTSIDPTITTETRLKVVKWAKGKFNGAVLFSTDDKKLVKMLPEQYSNGTTHLIIIAEKEFGNGQVIVKDLINMTQELIRYDNQ